MQTKTLSFLLFMCVLISQTIAQKTYFVASTLKGNGSGSDWNNTSNDLQAMINLAEQGEEVWVAAGKYMPRSYPPNCLNCADSQDFAFSLKNGVKVYGGFKGNEQSLLQRDFAHNLSILEGDLRQDDREPDALFDSPRLDNACHLLLSIADDSTTLLDGFMITGGAAKIKDSLIVEGEVIHGNYGGGIYCLHSSPTLRNIVLEDNKAWEKGGGMYNEFSAPTLINAVFQQDVNAIQRYYITSAKKGGAIYNKQSTITLYNGIFYRNVASVSGGAVYNDSSTCNIYNAIFTYNRGGFAGILNIASILNIKNTYFHYNLSSDPQAHIDIKYYLHDIASDTNSLVKKENCLTDNFEDNFMDLTNPKGVDKRWFTKDDGFRFKDCSPTKNAGTNDIPFTLDILGNDIYEDVKDIGVYELQTISYCVHFQYANAFRDNMDIVLKWKTDKESNLLRFEIERLDKGLLATIYPNTDTTALHTYTFTDEDPQKSTLNKYLLKMIYSDNSVSSIPFSVKFPFYFHPNPVIDELRIYEVMNRNDKFTILDEGGKIIYEADTIPFSFNFRSYPRGMYFIRMGEFTAKIVKINN